MRNWIWRAIKAILFRLDAETAHHVVLRLIRLGAGLGEAPLRIVAGAPAVKSSSESPEVFGLRFLSRVGLAAGFDKNAEVLTALPSLGFGFAEVGTVTPRPQPGNELPRLFREPARQALFNRMGFNNLGAAVVAGRLEDARKNLPAGFRVGINVGKNKDTPAEDAAKDYADALSHFSGLADYIVINVSSPNTPGLRSLQTVESLRPIVERMNETMIRWSVRPPLLLKLAPEVRGEDLRDILEAGESWGINGWVLTNTLGGAWRQEQRVDLPGGWSGLPLQDLSREVLIEARAVTRLPIISVGGIMTGEEAVERRKLGADLVQIYSAWVYSGPAAPADIARALHGK